MELLIDVEMRSFSELDVRVVFLQNIVTEVMLGFGSREFFLGYADYIREKHGAEPGFITMNLPRLVERLLEWGVENPIVCSSINKAGYFMNPDMRSYEQTIREKPFRPMAMSILASGAIPAQDAVDYVCGQPKIQSIVFGASSRAHIAETKRMIEARWGSASS